MIEKTHYSKTSKRLTEYGLGMMLKTQSAVKITFAGLSVTPKLLRTLNQMHPDTCYYISERLFVTFDPTVQTMIALSEENIINSVLLGKK